MTAAFCRCMTKEPSPVCPACEACLCSAPPAFRTSFWDRAPGELWTRRRESKRAVASAPHPETGDVKRPLVLIVDDDPMLRKIATAHVLSHGYGAISAENGAEGLRMASLYKPELVITDALMPLLDGREMARRIRRDHPATRIVVVTSVYTNGQHRREALREFGADEYLTKPLQVKQLSEILRRHLA